MKKTYSKPDIMFESFSMSTNIAGTCEAIVGNPSKDACGVLGTGNITIFDNTISACKFTPTDMGGEDDMWDGACYHVPIEKSTLFNS